MSDERDKFAENDEQDSDDVEAHRLAANSEGDDEGGDDVEAHVLKK